MIYRYLKTCLCLVSGSVAVHADLFTGIYTGTLSENATGWFVMVVDGKDHASALAWTDAGDAISLDFQINTSGVISIPVDGEGYLNGVVTDYGVLAMEVTGPGVYVDAQKLDATGPNTDLAGFYEGSYTGQGGDEESGSLWVLVSPDGKVWFYSDNGSGGHDGGAGTLSGDGFYVVGASGTSFTGTVGGDGNSISGIFAGSNLKSGTFTAPLHYDLGVLEWTGTSQLSKYDAEYAYEEGFGWIYTAYWPWLYAYNGNAWFYSLGSADNDWMWIIDRGWAWSSSAFWPWIWTEGDGWSYVQ